MDPGPRVAGLYALGAGGRRSTSRASHTPRDFELSFDTTQPSCPTPVLGRLRVFEVEISLYMSQVWLFYATRRLT